MPLGSRFNLVGLIMLVLIGLGIYLIVQRTPLGIVIGLGCLGLAVLVAWLRRRGEPRMRLSAGPHGIAWIHPVRGGGAMQWREVGALSLRRRDAHEAEAVCLIPRSGAAELTFILAEDDFGAGEADADRRLRTFVESVLPKLPEDLVIDRDMRRKMGEWGIRPPA